MQFHEYCMLFSISYLVEFHDIDIFPAVRYHQNIGVPRFWGEASYDYHIFWAQQKKIGALIREGRYDSVLYPPPERVPLRFSILRRNEWMATEAELILAYVRYGRGGAYRALSYAMSRKKRIINLAEAER